jgi:translation initiation factor IF-1
MAERVGFEPTVPFRVHLISSQARSTGLRHLSDQAQTYRRLAGGPAAACAAQPEPLTCAVRSRRDRGLRAPGVEGKPEGKRLARDDLLQATGTVEKILGGGRYKIVLEGGQIVTAQLSGRMRRFRIRVIPGDRVQVGVSPYDPTHGFITFRLREGQTTAR